MAIGVGGFVGIGVQASILHPDGVKGFFQLLRNQHEVWSNMKFGEISILTILSYNFTNENSTFFNIVFDLQILFTIDPMIFD